LEFATELIRRAELRRDKKETRPGVLEQIAAFFRQPAFAPIATLAVVVIVAGLLFFQLRPTANYQALSLTINDADRAEGVTPEHVKLPPNTGLKITLKIPENARGADDYKAKLPRVGDLEIEQRTPEAVTVIIPPGSLTPNTYAIQLFKVKPDKSLDRIPGSYYFAVE
jgi:hypothetical protein